MLLLESKIAFITPKKTSEVNPKFCPLILRVSPEQANELLILEIIGSGGRVQLVEVPGKRSITTT